MERGDWKELVELELGFSFHCGGTRDGSRANGKKLANDFNRGHTMAYCSHLIRSENIRSENVIPVGIELMRVRQQAYPEAVVASLGCEQACNIAPEVGDRRPNFIPSLRL